MSKGVGFQRNVQHSGSHVPNLQTSN
jgi:hypothetical protein